MTTKNNTEDVENTATPEMEDITAAEQNETTEETTDEAAAAAEETVEEPAPPTLEEELAAYKDKHLRMYSEFENFRRRSAKERIELMQNAGQEIITALLPILDDFDRAKVANENSEDIEAIKEGMDLIYTKIFTLLGQKGLKPMDAMGKDFNSDDHEAIAKIPSPEPKLKGKVIDVTEKGYFLNSKIIRHAKVVVGE